jgi:TIM-barrel protein
MPDGGPLAFAPRVAAASLSGESDAAWARRVAPYVGAAFLGGVCLDDASRAAAEAMVADRDRDEFLPADPFAFLDGEVSALADVPILPAFNVRSATPDPVARAAAICADHGAAVEVNAHCRQAELCDAGCGETLLSDADRLRRFVRAAAATDATVSVKVRAEVPGVDLAETARRIGDAGADAIHVDAMDSEPVIGEIVEAVPGLFVIANNGVRDRATVREYLAYGADAVSVARPTERPDVLERVRAAAEEWFEVEAPEHEARP